MFNHTLYALRLRLPAELQWAGARLLREEVLDRAWAELSLAGIDEGMVLSEQAHELGLETESWTVDSAEAPRERDWVGAQKSATVTFYFESRANADAGYKWIKSNAPQLVADGSLFPIEEIPPQDWNAQWKAAFRELAEGIPIPPFWRVVPAWEGADMPNPQPGVQLIGINPGAGFGTGTHPTTQLCLQALAECRVENRSVLDFGSGSGILAIGASLLGARVDAVEIDELAIENARENATINGANEKIQFVRELSEIPKKVYPFVVANILRPVLLQFCAELTERWEKEAPHARLILSGLVESDISEVSALYKSATGLAPKVMAMGEWRALVFEQSR